MKGKSGFSLIEVLVALVVVGIISGAAMMFLVSSINLDKDNRVRAQAVVSADSWLDRFRAKSLDFSAFTTTKRYPYGYDYADDKLLADKKDLDKEKLNDELSPYRFEVTATAMVASPLIWRVDVATFYKLAQGGESRVDLSTLVKQ